nr:tryptophan synthase subunit alpha [Gottschalkia acidurici]
MNRLDKRFKDLKERNEKALITFITSGVPDLETTEELVLEMEKAGADVVELGIPYSRPIADGKIIAEASKRALENGIKTSKVMEMVKNLREKTELPLVYLVYFNTVFAYGVDRFLSKCNEVGIDGIIIPDLPIEERDEVLEACKENYVHLIPLVAPTSKDRIKEITEGTGGFVYCVAVNGVTGTRDSINENIQEYMDTVSKFTDTPKAIGFGISSPEMAKEYKDYSDGVIVGSAIVRKILEGNSREEIVKSISSFVKELKDAVLDK